MTRIEFERFFASAPERKKTIAEMRSLGWWSAECKEDSELGGCGWQAVCIPPEALEVEKRKILMSLLGCSPKRFGA